MVVDKDEKELEFLKAELKKVYNNDVVVTFNDPFLAVQFATRMKVDVVFAELEMSGINGKTLGNMIEKINPSAMIVYIGCGVSFAQHKQMDKSGIYMSKPVYAEKIEEKLLYS